MIESEIASFGGVVVVRVDFRRVEIRGGTEDDRMRAERWVRQFLSPHPLLNEKPLQVRLVEGR